MYQQAISGQLKDLTFMSYIPPLPRHYHSQSLLVGHALKPACSRHQECVWFVTCNHTTDTAFYQNEIVIITKAIPPVSQDMASFAPEGPTQGE